MADSGELMAVYGPVKALRELHFPSFFLACRPCCGQLRTLFRGWHGDVLGCRGAGCRGVFPREIRRETNSKPQKVETEEQSEESTFSGQPSQTRCLGPSP